MKRPHILIADDTPQVLKLFKHLLISGGYDVTAVHSGDAALKVVEEKRVDLLVLDLDMPYPDGFELLKILRTTRPGLRILVVSGYMQGEMLKASEILGATGSLSKVAAPARLLDTVHSLLD